MLFNSKTEKKSRQILVFSDVHGNLEGLRIILRKIRSKRYEKVICLGDIVGYGADSIKCLALILAQDVVMLKGNHEAMLCEEESAEHCSQIGKASAVWTKKAFEGKNLAQIKAMQSHISFHQMYFCHTGTEDGKNWPYLNNPEQIWTAFEEVKEAVIFYGHTHRMRFTVFSKEGKLLEDRLIKRSEKISIDRNDGNHYFINTGSVGQQRDERTDCGYVELQEKGSNLTIHFIRRRYPDYITYRKIAAHGCGEQTAQYLIREAWKKRIYKKRIN